MSLHAATDASRRFCKRNTAGKFIHTTLLTEATGTVLRISFRQSSCQRTATASLPTLPTASLRSLYCIRLNFFKKVAYV